MRVMLRIIGAFASLLIILCFVAAGAAAFLFATEAGQDLVQEQTAVFVGRLLGPDYTVDLGEQSFEMRPDGFLALSWTDVSLVRNGRPDARTEVRRVAAGLRLMPLVGGRFEFGRLEMEGARVNVQAFTAEPGAQRANVASSDRRAAPAGSIFSRTGKRAIQVLEQRLRSVQALRFDTVAFSDITVDGLAVLGTEARSLRIRQADLYRDFDGTLQFAADLSAGSVPLSIAGHAAVDAGGILRSIELRSQPVDLAAISPPAPASDPGGERAFGSDAAVGVTLAVSREAGTGTAVATATLRIGPGIVQTGPNRVRIESADLRLGYRDDEDRVRLLPSPVRFEGVAFTAQGMLEPSGASGGIGDRTLRFRVGSEDLRSTIGTPPATVEPKTATLRLDGVFDPAAKEVRLAGLELATDGGRLAGEGVFRYGAPDALTSLRLVGSSLQAGSIKAFWPANIAGKPRKWVLEHVGDEAEVTRAHIGVDLRFDRLRTAFKPDGGLTDRELRLGVEIRQADVAGLAGLPRIWRANGRLWTRGAVTTVVVDDAMVEAYEAVALSRSVVTLQRAAGRPERSLEATVKLAIAGSLPQLLAIADGEPINAFRKLDLAPESMTGTGTVNAMARLHLGEGIGPGEQLQAWSVDGTVADASLAQPVEGRRLSGLSGEVKIVPGQASGTLAGAVDEIPADIAFAIPFGGAPLGSRSIELDLALTAEKAIELVPALQGVIDGPIRAAVTQDDAGLRATLDLDDATLDLPLVAWQKGKGVEADVSFDVERSDAETVLRNIRVDGAGFSAGGSIAADEGGLRSADFAGVSLNPGDDLAVAVRRAGNGYSIEIEGSQFDARPILQELKDTIGRPADDRAGGGAIDLAASIERLSGFGGETLNGFSLNYAGSKGRTAALVLSGSLNGEVVAFDLAPRDDGQALRLQAGNAGALIDFAGLYGQMEGGSASLALTGSAATGYGGELRLNNFTLVDEPRLSRIVGSSPSPDSASLSQALGQDLQTERAFFDQASARLAYRDGGLRVAEGIVRGPVFGSSFEGLLYGREGRIDISGSFMPAYGINRIFGAIPIVGQILGNGNEGGLIGITYNLSGAFSSPTLTVNPISAIAPGIFRQIFAYE